MIRSMSGHAASAAVAVRDVLRNRSIRRIELAWTTGTAADWALLVVLLVIVYDAGGTVAAGIMGAVRVVPGIVAGPFATTIVERYRGDRALTVINAVRAGGAVATAVVVAADLPLELTYLLAASRGWRGIAGATDPVRAPPRLRPHPGRARCRERGVEHWRRHRHVHRSAGRRPAGRCDRLRSGQPAGGRCVRRLGRGRDGSPLRERSGRARRDRRRPDGSLSLERRARLVRRYPAPAILIGDFVAQTFVRGLLITLIVVASIELLDMGNTGVGFLNAAIGLGGLVGAVAALGLRGGSRLGKVCLVALACWGLPLLLIGAWVAPAVALSALFVTGVANAILDISGFTLLQRGVRNEDRVAVFGIFEGLLGIGLLLGSLVAPLLVEVLGARGAFVVAGAFLPLLALVTWMPVIRRLGGPTVSDTTLDLLRKNPLFAPLPLTALDRLAESLVPMSFAPGAVVLRKGDPGDHYLLIAEGEVEVTDDGHSLGMFGPGEGVGEIALLHRVPRTATVSARTPVSAFAIDGTSFLAAVAGPTAAALAEAVAAARIERSAELERPIHVKA